MEKYSLLGAVNT